MAQINSALGAKSATYGLYAQIQSSSFDGKQLTDWLDDVKSSGAVFVASVMPSIPFSEVTSDVAQQVAAVMKKFTDEGLEVWLRFGHEMNWYVKDDKPTYKGTAPEFIEAWKNIYEANCKGNDKVKCFWSPNRDDIENIKPWWPGQEFVDIVGIDCYPQEGEDTSDQSLFGKLYDNFYDTYSKAFNLPFAIGETGAGDGQKDNWLKQLVSQDHAKYPNYISMSWFEFDKEADFRVVITDDATLQKTKDTLLSGSGGSCGGGTAGNGTDSSNDASPTSGTVSSKLAGNKLVTIPTPSPEPKQEQKQDDTCTWG